LGYGNYIFLAVVDDPLEVFFFPVYPANVFAVDVVLGGSNAKKCSEQLKRGEIFIIAEPPELHGVNHKDLIGFLAGDIEQGRQWNSLNQHAATEIGHIKLFDVMPAEEQVFGMLNMIEQFGKFQ
jgi:hypothetical protein